MEYLLFAALAIACVANLGITWWQIRRLECLAKNVSHMYTALLVYARNTEALQRKHFDVN